MSSKEDIIIKASKYARSEARSLNGRLKSILPPLLEDAQASLARKEKSYLSAKARLDKLQDEQREHEEVMQRLEVLADQLEDFEGMVAKHGETGAQDLAFDYADEISGYTRAKSISRRYIELSGF